MPGVENIKAESTTNTSRQNSRKRSFRQEDSAAEPFESSGSSTAAVRAQSPINKKPPIQVQKAAKISIQIASDSDHPTVNGIAATKEFIAVRDNANKKFKLFNIRGGLEKFLDIHDSYFESGIVLANKGTMVAIVPVDASIILYRIFTNELVKEKAISKFPGSCRDITSNGNLCCLLMGTNTVIIYPMDGKEAKSIAIKEAFGKGIKFGHHLYLDSDEKLFVSCEGLNKGIICLTIAGTPLWFQALPGTPRGVTKIDGYLCIADSSSNCIHVLSTSGKHCGQRLAKIDLEGDPNYIFFDKTVRKLYVSHRYTSNTVSVFNVK